MSDTYWDRLTERNRGRPGPRHHKPRPLYGGKFGRSLIGYVCDCCNRLFSPNMRETGPRLANQPPPDGRVIAHQAPHRAPQFHHWLKEWGRESRSHAERVAAR